MSAPLEITVDKFTFRVPTDRLYTRDGAWVLPVEPTGAGKVRVGVTDFLQQRSGDVTFATVRPPGTRLGAGDDVAEIETIKVNVALPTPVAGTVVEINPALETTPEVVNQDPYGAGWLAVMAVADWDADRAGLLTPEAYLTHMRQQAEREVETS